MAQICFAQIDDLSRRIAEIEGQIAAANWRTRSSARLQKMPGVGPNTFMCLDPAIDAPSSVPARTGDGVGYSAKHLVA